MKNPLALERLTQALRVLPSIGPKSAQRMAYHLLQQDRKGAEQLVAALNHALNHIQHCRLCNTFTETDVCGLCADESRHHKSLMVVHMPADVASLEAAKCHDGLYFVLMGQVSPTQQLDLDSIDIKKLTERLKNSDINEIIIATNFTAEGDATAYVLSELFKTLPYKVSRLARGMPLGGELDYIDAGTLAQAVYERRLLKDSTGEPEWSQEGRGDR